MQLKNSFTPSGLNSRFDSGDGTYPGYIDRMRDIILSARVDLTPDNTDFILQANSPSETITASTDHGVLLVHGLFDSPYSMMNMFQALKSTEQFHLRTLLLPGHGTVPGDLLDVTLEDWLEALRFALQTFPPTIKRITVIGHSTGAGLALQVINEHLRIDRLVLLAPPMRLINIFAPFAHIHRYFSEWFPSMAWYQQLEENNHAKYTSITYNSVAQVVRLAKNIQYQHCPCPILMIVTNEDEIISTPAALDYLSRQPHPENQAILYSSMPRTDVASNVTVINSTNMSEHILDYSHNCLPNSPDHPYYGRHGAIISDHHYRTWWGKWLPHQTDPVIYHGAITLERLKQYHLYRLTYNPHFDDMMAKILGFMSV